MNGDRKVGSPSFDNLSNESEYLRAVDFAKRLVGDEVSSVETVDDKTGDLVGTNVGPFKISEVLGEGGMGMVYSAEQEEPVRRRVAVKVIKPGMDSREIVSRFESERQSLAMMDHPNIAKVFDAGTTEAGLPYFVMELIKGVTITKYCDENCSPIEDRLRLFVEVCQAVQHAHQKGVIHRDLKPNNILVSVHNNQAAAKVIDFGVAKAVDHHASDKTAYTKASQIVGTPLYMSPEQAGYSGADIDTRTDVYSLGVLLYELLTGSTPFTKQEFDGQALEKIREVIRETDPPRPSERVNTLDASAQSTIAQQRQTQNSKLIGSLRGDLDWIVMKAMEKDRSRRYDTAIGLANDVNRFLSGEPVLARPPSTGYRFKKFISKNQGLAASVASIMLVLLAGIGGTTWFALGERSQRQLAQLKTSEAANEANKASREADRANKEAMRWKDALLIFTDSFDSVNPEEGANAKMLAKDVLFRAKESLQESKLDDQGRVELYMALYKSFIGVGEYEIAAEVAEKELELRKKSNQDLWKARSRLGVSYRHAGRYRESLDLLKQVYDQRRVELGVDDPEVLKLTINLTDCYRQLGQYSQSLQMEEEVVRLQKIQLGSDHQSTLIAMTNLANTYLRMRRAEDAIKLNEQVLKHRVEQLGEDHPHTLTTMNNLASSYSYAGQYDKAASALKETVRIRNTKLGEDHPDTLMTNYNLANVYLMSKRADKAVEILEEVLPILKAKFGPDHPDTLSAENSLAGGYDQTDQTQKAIEIFERVLKYRTDKLGRKHPSTLNTMTNLSACYQQVERISEAARLLEETLRLRRESMPKHPHTIVAIARLGRMLVEVDPDRAVELLTELLEYRAASEPSSLRTTDTRIALGKALLNQKMFDEATKQFSDAFDVLKTNAAKVPDRIRSDTLHDVIDHLIEIAEQTDDTDALDSWRIENEKLNEETKSDEESG